MNEHVSRPLRAVLCEESENIGSNPTTNQTMGDVIAARYSRRGILKGSLAVSAVAAMVSPVALFGARDAKAAGSTPSFDFDEIEAGVDADDHVAPGYMKKVLIRWGDPVEAGAPEFDPMNQSAEAQSKQFGYNNDFLGLAPHPEAPDDPNRALLVVNHEYTNEELMFPGIVRQDGDANFADMTKELVDIEIAAHGGSVLEIVRENGDWRVVPDSRYNRRITGETPMTISGPAAGHARLQTSADSSGRNVFGMLNNCAGGMTPWGTWLTAEENFHGYFWAEEDFTPSDEAMAAAYKRYGVPGKWYAWGKFHDRFDVSKEPNEPNRFGWIVEIDPADPSSTPVKRTALGRFKHEGAHSVVNGDGRLVVVMGDDQRFDYVYRYVSNGTYDADADAATNGALLDDGVLSVARFNEDGSVDWLPLVHGEGPLTAENGFNDQADVVIEARRAGDLLGATKMDRPEDVEPNPVTGKIYVMLTNNSRRKAGDENPANPRAENKFGHIVEIIAPDKDFAADTMQWEILVQCGDPSIAEVGATFSPETSENGWFGMPDNCAVDSDGRLWISTDGNNYSSTGRTDGVWAMETEGESRGTSKLFYRVPVGAELCGPVFTQDGETLFVAVQHPGEDADGWPEVEGDITFENPATRWPDFRDDMPTRPSVVVITKEGGGKIAS